MKTAMEQFPQPVNDAPSPSPFAEISLEGFEDEWVPDGTQYHMPLLDLGKVHPRKSPQIGGGEMLATFHRFCLRVSAWCFFLGEKDHQSDGGEIPKLHLLQISVSTNLNARQSVEEHIESSGINDVGSGDHSRLLDVWIC